MSRGESIMTQKKKSNWGGGGKYAHKCRVLCFLYIAINGKINICSKVPGISRTMLNIFPLDVVQAL